jgi:DNA (cytosine-5)-methyltransferase 1
MCQVVRHDGTVDTFTIDEIKALQSFPADFILTGTYAQAWTRIGNSVPPLMMRAVATTIRDEILAKT